MMGEEIRHFQKVFQKIKKHPMDVGFVCNKGWQTTAFVNYSVFKLIKIIKFFYYFLPFVCFSFRCYDICFYPYTLIMIGIEF